MKKNTILTRLFLFIGIVVVLNFLANRFFMRLDFTGDKRYTLSDATINILNNLKNPVTVTAYFSENLPPDIGQTRRDFNDLLIEFEQRSHGNVMYEFINPNESEQSEQKAQQAGIQPVLVNMRERDQIKQQRAYLGAVVTLGEGKEVIPVLQPGAAMEYALSSTIKKISVSNKPKVAFLTGHGEATIETMSQARELLNVLYDVEPLTLSDTTTIEKGKYKAITIINPKDSLSPNHLNQLDQFMQNGGNIFIAMNRVEGDLKNLMGESKTTAIEQWLMNKGIQVEDNFIRDSKCGAVTVRQQQGFFTFNSQMNFPYFPIISKFSDHPVTKGLEGVLMPFVSSITIIKNDTNLKITPIAMSSEKSGFQKAPVMFNVMQQWQQTDFQLSFLPVAVAVQGKITGSTNSKMVVIADGDFAVNGEGQSQMQLPEDNVSLMVNSIDWLSDDTGLIDLRTKGVTNRPLKQIEDGTKTIIKYSNILIPIILILIYGFIRYQRQQKKRQNWMEDNY